MKAVPKTKKDLLDQCCNNYRKLNELIDLFPEEEQHSEFSPGTMNRNIRDVLAHLYHWHLMLLDWYAVGMNGNMPDMPAKILPGRRTKELNTSIYKSIETTSWITLGFS